MNRAWFGHEGAAHGEHLAFAAGKGAGQLAPALVEAGKSSKTSSMVSMWSRWPLR